LSTTPTAAGAADERITADSEMVFLLEQALKSARGDGLPRYLLTAVRDAADAALNRRAREELARASTGWEPRPEQIWKDGMRTPDNKRLTAWMVFKTHYDPIPYPERPFAHQVRQHPKTKDLYDALCVFVSRNKAKGLPLSSISELFPVTNVARGGLLSERTQKRGVRK
jgi:hypothetical protein